MEMMNPSMFWELTVHAFSLWWVIVPAVLLGIVVGAIPGFSAQNTLIITLPLTLAMDVNIGLAFMVSLYCASHLGGGIPSILVNMPGTGGHVATTLDGYPMNLQGRGQQALVLSFVASVVGGLITSVATVLLIPWLSQMGLYLRSVEMVVVMAFGLVLIAAIATDDLVKGVISGLFGLMLGAIGTDHIYGTPRATFGFLELYDSLPLVPVLIGLLALSEAFVMVERTFIISKDNIKEVKGARWEQTFEGFRLSIKYWWQLVWTAFLGLLIGIVPGAGASISSFVAYAQSRVFSKTPELYGTGHPPGVIAAEASNNGTTSGTLVPLMAIGVPGGTTAAVMMVVLVSHGVTLGPRLFTETPELAYGVFFAMAASYAIMLLLILPLARFMSKVVLVPTQVLVPLIVALTIIGSYANREYIFDMYLALLFGVIGYIARRTDYNVIGMVIGVLLGPLFEAYLLRSLRLSMGDITTLFSSPIGNTLWVLLVVTMLFPYARSKMQERHRQKQA